MSTSSAAVTPLIYVGSYAKYNSGSLFGEWFDLSDYSDKDDFLSACLVLHHDEVDPELMFQDWEGIPSAFISEGSISAGFWQWFHDIECLSLNEQAAFSDYADDFVSEEVTVRQFQEAYYGHFESEVDFAEHLAEQMEYYVSMEKVGLNASYFDAAAYARDLFCNNFWMSKNGHVFAR